MIRLMDEENNRFVESKVRTNKLYCSNCHRDIRKGEKVVFELTEMDTMENVYCSKCNEGLVDIEDTFDALDSYSLGQE